MTKTSRNASILLALAIGAAVLWFISMRNGDTASSAHDTATPGHPARPATSTAESAGTTSPTDLTTPPPGKSEIRPGPAELARRRLEMRRTNVTERLQKLKEAGMGDRHPSVVATTEELQKIQAELAATPGSDTSSD
jgi:hypothetical protein